MKRLLIGWLFGAAVTYILCESYGWFSWHLWLDKENGHRLNCYEEGFVRKPQ